MDKIKQKVLVTAIIIENGKILMQKRTDELDTHKGKWTTPSGVVKINENPKDTIIREVKEELDLNIKIISMIPVVDSFPNHKQKLHLIYLAFLCKIISGELKNVDEDGDVSEVAWIDLQDLNKINLIRGTMPPISATLRLEKIQL